MQRFNPGWACGFLTIGISIISNGFDSLFYQYNENQTEQLPDANVWFGYGFPNPILVGFQIA